MNQQKVGAIITAAGKRNSDRMFEPLKELGNISVVKRLVVTLQCAGVEPIVVITGHQAEEVERHLSDYGVVFLRNERYEETHMFESAKIGCSYLEGKCDRILFTKVDVPFFTTETVNRLLEQKGGIISPVYEGKTGHPICINSVFIPQILSYDGEGGMKGFLRSMQQERVWIEVKDEGVLYSSEQSSNSQALLEVHNKQIFHSHLTISLAKENIFFDKRAKMLLLMIEDTHSVRGACKRMAMSYSKAWNVLNTMEQELGFPVVQRQHGGKAGGKTYLSEQGRRFLNQYLNFENSIKQFAKQRFEEIFSNPLQLHEVLDSQNQCSQ